MHALGCCFILFLIEINIFKVISCAILRASSNPSTFEPILIFGIKIIISVVVQPCPCGFIPPVFLELCPSHVLAVVLHDVSGLHVLAHRHEGLLLTVVVDMVSDQRPHLVAVQALVVLVGPFLAADPPTAGALLLADNHPDGVDEGNFLILGELFYFLQALQQVFLALVFQKFRNELLKICYF